MKPSDRSEPFRVAALGKFGLIVVVAVLPAFAQDAADTSAPPGASNASQSTQGEEHRSALDVRPGEPDIKNKDLFEKSGILHPLLRLPRFVASDQKKIWTSPFHTSLNDAKYWAIFGAATGVLIGFDERIENAAPKPSGLVSLGTNGSYLGAAYTLIPISAGFYLIGSKTSNERFREAGLMSFEALIDSTLVEEVLKIVTDRERPLDGTGKGRFFHSPDRFNSSFPSGHSINTFALASIFAHQYHDKLWVKILTYAYAGGVASARLAARRHFASDTLAGGAMGWFIGDYIYGKRHNSNVDKPTFAQKVLDHVHFGLAAY